MAAVNYRDKQFLIVDNIKPSLDILKKFAWTLTEKNVDSTLYAQDVISMCLEKNYDVILLGYDLGLNKKNGQQVLEELRQSETISRHCVVIMITAEVSQAMVLAAIEHKPDDYLSKPYTLAELQKRLDKCVRKKSSMAPIYKAAEEGDIKGSIALIDKALKNHTPYKIECLGIKSRQLFELKEYEQAQHIYKRYVEESNCQWAGIGLGKIALLNHDYHSAETIFKNIIDKSPLYLPSYDWLATTYKKQLNNLSAEETLALAIRLSPRSVSRVQNYANLCFSNAHYQEATEAFLQVNKLAYNSIHQSPLNPLMYAKSLANFSNELPLVEAKKLNNTAFAMMNEMNRTYRQAALKIESLLCSASLLENVHDYSIAKKKLSLGLSLLDKEQNNIDDDSLKGIAQTLKKLNINSRAAQLILKANQQEINSTNETKIGALSKQQLGQSYTEKAQKALIDSKALFDSKHYDKAISYLNEALLIFPNHMGIKLNLIQVLLAAYEKDNEHAETLQQAKKMIISLLNITKENEHYVRFKRMKKKYQQLAGI